LTLGGIVCQQDSCLTTLALPHSCCRPHHTTGKLQGWEQHPPQWQRSRESLTQNPSLASWTGDEAEHASGQQQRGASASGRRARSGTGATGSSGSGSSSRRGSGLLELDAQHMDAILVQLHDGRQPTLLDLAGLGEL
jgi:hypothetical protein